MSVTWEQFLYNSFRFLVANAEKTNPDLTSNFKCYTVHIFGLNRSKLGTYLKLNACTKYNTVYDVMVTLTSFMQRHVCSVIFATSFSQRHFDSQNHSHFLFRSKPQA